MRKRIISTLMALLLMAGFVGNAACGTESMTGSVYGTEEVEEILSREQWIIGLGSVFGMNEYVTEEPFFDDVDSSEEVYPFLQSCAEWGIFQETGGSFEPETGVTREYAVETAVMAAEVLNDDGAASVYEQCISYALDKGILTSDKEDYLNEVLTYAQGQEILDWAVFEYQNREFVEYANVELAEDVIDLSDADIEAKDTMIIPAEEAVELQTGDVFIAPGDMESPDGIARKVTSVSADEAGNLLVETVEPELEDIYKELDFAVRAVPDAEDVTVSEGVTLASFEDSGIVYADMASKNTLENGMLHISAGGGSGGGGGGNWGDDTSSNSGAKFGFTLNFTKGTPKLNAEWESSLGKFKADLEEGGGDEKAGELYEKSNTLYKGKADGTKVIDEIDNKFTAGYEITGSLTIKDFYIDVEAHPKKVAGIPVGVEDFVITTNYTAESTLKVKGKLKDELTISTFHIQTPVPGLTVKVEAILYANASGELEVKFTTSNVTTLSYSEGKTKKVNSSTAEAPDIVAAIKIEVGAAIKAAPCILGKEIIDVKVKAGVKYEFKSDLGSEERTEERDGEILTIRTWNWEVQGTKVFPVVSIEGGNSSKCLLKLKLSWELVGDKGLVKVPKQTMYEYSLLLSEEVIDRESIESTEEDLTEETELSGEDGILDDSEMLDIESYMLAIGIGEAVTIDIISIPEGYSMSDLHWESDNTAVANVNGGTVTGVGEGTAQIRVYTPDEKYQILCTIIVSDEEVVEFHSL